LVVGELLDPAIIIAPNAVSQYVGFATLHE
jgi:hypothetical protein